MPETDFTQAEWELLAEQAGRVDRKEQFVTPCVWPGLFENCHHLMGMVECMISFYEEPDALYRHDDWGSQKFTFMFRDMFYIGITESTGWR